MSMETMYSAPPVCETVSCLLNNQVKPLFILYVIEKRLVKVNVDYLFVSFRSEYPKLLSDLPLNKCTKFFVWNPAYAWRQSTKWLEPSSGWLNFCENAASLRWMQNFVDL